jgi:hypothetical protein
MGLAAVTIVAAATMLLRSPKRRGPVPEASEIRSMEATFDRDGASEVTFQVPATHWQPILSALLPAKKDPDPAKWVGLGELQIKLGGGDSFLISLYSLSETPGAFSSGPDWEQRTYYRGGSTVSLERALEDAFKASDENRSK